MCACGWAASERGENLGYEVEAPCVCMALASALLYGACHQAARGHTTTVVSAHGWNHLGNLREESLGVRTCTAVLGAMDRCSLFC